MRKSAIESIENLINQGKKEEAIQRINNELEIEENRAQNKTQKAKLKKLLKEANKLQGRGRYYKKARK